MLGVCLEGMVLKPNMITKGKSNEKDSTSHEEVAQYTIVTLLRSVPAAVPAIFFLSGGQSEEEASLNLNAMNSNKNLQRPWYLSFSFGRALQYSCIMAWNGDINNT